MFVVVEFEGKLVPVVKWMYTGDASRIKGEYKNLDEARAAHPDLVTDINQF